MHARSGGIIRIHRIVLTCPTKHVIISYGKIAFKELRPAWFGSCAMGCREPCQVRKEAAISGSSYVPQTSLLQRLRSSLRAIFLDCAKKIDTRHKNVEV